MKFSDHPNGVKVMFLSVVIFFVFIIGVAIFQIFDKTPPSVTNYNVQVIDSCEYIVSDYYKSRTITHKGNCKFCQAKFMKHDSIK
jgi:hypothetical protein